MFRAHVVSAVFWRNVKQYFSSVLGYLFIVVFVTVCAVLAFNQKFFADNLANLDQLSNWFPFLLLFIVPAITMTVWADEKKEGTDAILFTLPASDFEITLGKYLSVAAVYTIALLFSTTQLVALKLIGDPDWGVIIATYVGYWLSGLALLAIGMYASSLTSSPTVAFVGGTVMCAIPVLIGQFSRGSIWLEQLGIAWNLEDFTDGLIPLANVVYFVSIIVFMLYLNLVEISKRHWRVSDSGSLAAQYILRIACLGVAVLSLNYVARSWSSSDWTRADLTAEKLFTLDKTTLAAIESAKENKRPITIQAFVSEEVPRSYVNAKKQFLGLLRQYDYYGGNYVDVRLVNVKPNSPQEDEAIKSGIQPIEDRSEVGGRMVEQSVFLGAHLSSPIDDATLPTIDSNTALEYEMTRMFARTTGESPKLTVAILDTDLRFGCVGNDGEKFPEWWTFTTTMKRLRNDFKVKLITQEEFPGFTEKVTVKEEAEEAESTEDEKSEVGDEAEVDVATADKTETAKADETEKDTSKEIESESEEDANKETEDKLKEQKSKKAPDVLIVADPASLNEACYAELLGYIKAGHPVILLSDPMPFYLRYLIPAELGYGLINAPLMPRFPAQLDAAELLTSSPLAKAEDGKCDSLHQALGMEVTMGDVAWNLSNPYPNFNFSLHPLSGRSDKENKWQKEDFGPYDQAVNFVRSEDGNRMFSSRSQITSGTRELLFFYPGSIAPNTETSVRIPIDNQAIWGEFIDELIHEFLPGGEEKELEFKELVSLGSQSGITPWSEIVYTPTQMISGIAPSGQIVSREIPARSELTGEPRLAPRPEAPNNIDKESYTIAAHIRGTKDKEGNRKNKTNVIYVADTDFLSEMYYIQEKELGESLDNYTFLLNAIEVLTGDKDLVSLRNRRPVLRTLTGFEKQINLFRKSRADKTKEVEKKIREQRKEVEAELEAARREITQDKSLGMIQQAQMFSQTQTDALNRGERLISKLNDELEEEIQTLKSTETQQIAAKESQIRWLSVLLAPLPALLLGFIVLSIRAADEKRTIDPRRRVGASPSARVSLQDSTDENLNNG